MKVTGPNATPAPHAGTDLIDGATLVSPEPDPIMARLTATAISRGVKLPGHAIATMLDGQELVITGINFTNANQSSGEVGVQIGDLHTLVGAK